MLAAVYLDGGIGSARKLIQKFILDREAEKSASRDYKTALQELVQRESGQVLGYQLIGAEGPDHAKIFSVEVDLNGIPIGQGRGQGCDREVKGWGITGRSASLASGSEPPRQRRQAFCGAKS